MPNFVTLWLESGVNILAYDCIVTRDELKIDQPVKIKLKENK